MVFKVEIMPADIIQILWEDKHELTDGYFEGENAKACHMDDADTEKRKRILTEKRKQYRASILDWKKKALVSRINRKMSEIDILLHTHENDFIVKEELQQLNDVLKLTDEVNKEIIELDDNYTEDMWFSDIDDKVSVFKHNPQSVKERRSVIEIWKEIRIIRKKLGIVRVQIFKMKFNFKF